MSDEAHAHAARAADPDDRYALVVDLGTTGAKIGLASLSGRLAWSENHELETTHLADGGATQDAGHWWDVISAAAARGLGGNDVDPTRVEAVAVTGQWASTIPVDGDGVPVGPCVMWMDSRGGAEARRRVGGPVAGYRAKPILSWIRRSGGAPALDGADPLGHLWYLRSAEPDIWRSARWFLEPVDYLTMRFTGVATASPASMTLAWLTDNRDLTTTTYDPVLLSLAGLDDSRLAPLRPTLTPIGRVQETVAERLGLGPDVAVVTGLPDLHASALGVGAVDDFATHLGISTSSWFSCHTPTKKTDVIRQIASVPGAVADHYLVACNHETSGRSFQWARDLLSPEGAPIDLGDLCDLAGAAPPGSGGVLFTPWLSGERSPVADRNARGGFHNLSVSTGRSDLARSVLEGVAYNDRWLFEAVEKFVGRRLDDIRVFGGGAQSDLWLQIHADVMDRNLEQVADPLNVGLRGSAFAAAIALGALAPSDLHDLVPVAARFAPHPANQAAYNRLYAEFPKLYSSQKRMFKRLNSSP
jgi:xylulokinase